MRKFQIKINKFDVRTAPVAKWPSFISLAISTSHKKCTASIKMTQFHLILCLAIPHLSSSQSEDLLSRWANFWWKMRRLLTEFPSLLFKEFNSSCSWFHCSLFSVLFVVLESAVSTFFFSLLFKDREKSNFHKKRTFNKSWVCKRKDTVILCEL